MVWGTQKRKGGSDIVAEPGKRWDLGRKKGEKGSGIGVGSSSFLSDLVLLLKLVNKYLSALKK